MSSSSARKAQRRRRHERQIAADAEARLRAGKPRRIFTVGRVVLGNVVYHYRQHPTSGATDGLVSCNDASCPICKRSKP